MLCLWETLRRKPVWSLWRTPVFPLRREQSGLWRTGFVREAMDRDQTVVPIKHLGLSVHPNIPAGKLSLS